MAPKKRTAVSTASRKASAFGTSSKAGITSSAQSKKQKASVPAPEVSSPSLEEKNFANAYPKLFKKSQKLMGTPVHGQDFDPIEVILRVWDSTEDYGPCSNLTRLERWERAVKLGLNPPPEIGDILKSKPGRTRAVYRDPVFNV